MSLLEYLAERNKMDMILTIQDIIAISQDLPQEQRAKFLKSKFDEKITEINEFIKYLETENIEMRLTLFTKGSESEFPYKVEQIIGRLMANL